MDPASWSDDPAGLELAERVGILITARFSRDEAARLGELARGRGLGMVAAVRALVLDAIGGPG